MGPTERAMQLSGVMRVVYATFENRDQAHAALTEIRTLLGHDDVPDTTAHLHEGYVANRRLPRKARLSMRGALTGGLIGATLGAVAGLFPSGAFASVGGPTPILHAHAPLALSVALAAGAFGVLAGMLSGAAANRKPIEQMRERVEDGEVLMTIDADDREVEAALDIARGRDATVAGSLA